ncbi:hypothetical protein D9758_002657 [Tetrapyrgos nigripes]|uniref:Enoyl reductase (ER) domain-containing protein n=1 Tax=Tetrapyrgos nigripes TaxID=182062 RepID=A0A8H5LU44_9AGAR|nr:hypothetical protein D9758_002657 [Tetrapyrgos nigripes]
MFQSQQKALLLERKYGPFVVSTFPRPTSALPGELLIKVQAAALNPVDWIIQKTSRFHETYPVVCGSDIAGDVEDVGEGVTLIIDKEVDRVCQGYHENDYAGFQQYARVPAEIAAKIPEKISYSQASSLPLALATAAIGLYAESPSGIGLNPTFDSSVNFSGQVAIVIGGSTSVGQLAIQLLRLAKFDSIITYASAQHDSYLKSLGATECIDRKEVSLTALSESVKRITSAPVTVVYDAVCSSQSAPVGYDILASGGRMVYVLQDHIQNKVEDKKAIRVSGNVHILANREFGKIMYSKLTKFLEDGIIMPNKVEDLPGGLAGIVDGLERLEAGKVSGIKLVAHPQDTT